MNNKFVILCTALIMIIIALMYRQCSSPIDNPTKGKIIYQTTTDTTYIVKDTVVYKNRPAIHITDTVTQIGDTVFVADTNYVALKKQYEELVNRYKVRNIYLDTFPIDTIGNIFLSDTIQYNNIVARSFHIKYSLPVVSTKEISEPKHLFYFGGGVSLANKKIRQAQFGLLYKPAKKNVIGIHLGAGTDEIGRASCRERV